ncbi:hypothetical protein K474DRAFT_1371847 [Panus rudis PR-1116 ss-1]|nr:hypothetical protein K474DRAFT_1371847 [Panus rudis PR-1116 ss-1]
MRCDSLIDDVLIHLITLLPVEDLLTFRKTCKRFADLTKLRTVWCQKFTADVLQKNLPIPGSYLPFVDIPANELEWRTLRALSLSKKWRFPSRQTQRTVTLPLTDSTVRDVFLLPGGQHALTVHADCLTAWAMSLPIPKKDTIVTKIASWKLSPSGSHVVCDRSQPNRIAMQNVDDGIISIISVQSTSDNVCRELGQTTCGSQEGKLVGLLDEHILLELSQDDKEKSSCGVMVKNWTFPNQAGCLLRAPDHIGRFLNFAEYKSHLVIVWEGAITVFPIPSPHSQERQLDAVGVIPFDHPVQAPVSITACQPRSLPGKTEQLSDATSCLSIIVSREFASTWGRNESGVAQYILYPAQDGAMPFGFARIPRYVKDCSNLAIGPSGRGIWSCR